MNILRLSSMHQCVVWCVCPPLAPPPIITCLCTETQPPLSQAATSSSCAASWSASPQERQQPRRHDLASLSDHSDGPDLLDQVRVYLPPSLCLVGCASLSISSQSVHLYVRLCFYPSLSLCVYLFPERSLFVYLSPRSMRLFAFYCAQVEANEQKAQQRRSEQPSDPPRLSSDEYCPLTQAPDLPLDGGYDDGEERFTASTQDSMVHSLSSQVDVPHLRNAAIPLRAYTQCESNASHSPSTSSPFSPSPPALRHTLSPSTRKGALAVLSPLSDTSSFDMALADHSSPVLSALSQPVRTDQPPAHRSSSASASPSPASPSPGSSSSTSSSSAATGSSSSRSSSSSSSSSSSNGQAYPPSTGGRPSPTARSASAQLLRPLTNSHKYVLEPSCPSAVCVYVHTCMCVYACGVIVYARVCMWEYARIVCTWYVYIRTCVSVCPTLAISLSDSSVCPPISASICLVQCVLLLVCVKLTSLLLCNSPAARPAARFSFHAVSGQENDTPAKRTHQPHTPPPPRPRNTARKSTALRKRCRRSTSAPSVG
jgi:hypothetical protein